MSGKSIEQRFFRLTVALAVLVVSSAVLGVCVADAIAVLASAGMP